MRARARLSAGTLVSVSIQSIFSGIRRGEGVQAAAELVFLSVLCVKGKGGGLGGL